MIHTPVLLITFNRPNHTRKVLGAILAAKPQDLYVFQDGAREGNESDLVKCAEVRRVISELIQEQELVLHTNYSDKNLGCGPGPMTALNWFFSENDMGIVLEDDAVPHPDFFPYAEELLQKYKNDESVCAIGSMNVDTQKWGDGSYYFSMMNRNLCAWATWRRAWKPLDLRLLNVSRLRLRRALRWYGCGILEREYWCDRLDEIHKDGCDGQSWDMQFIISIWLKCGKGIIPNVNLTSNIGTVDEATHPMNAGNLIENVPTFSILPLVHPSSCEIQKESDRQFHFRYFEPGKSGWGKAKTFYYLLNKRLKKLIGHQGPWLKKEKMSFTYFIQKLLGRWFDQPIIPVGKTTGYSLVRSEKIDTEMGTHTRLAAPFFLHIVRVGDYSYIAKNSNVSNCVIGKFCSIGPNFCCGLGAHPTNGISTAPMFYSTAKQNGMTLCKENKVEESKQTIIGNDVFIGVNVTVLDGVKIGDGAVIGAGAVVVDDIPSYAIAVGVPAKVVKYRFDDQTINALLEKQWWNASEEELKKVERNFWDVESFLKGK